MTEALVLVRGNSARQTVHILDSLPMTEAEDVDQKEEAHE